MSFFRKFLATLSWAAAASTGLAATLNFDVHLHLKPEAGSAVVATLPAGSTLTALIREELSAEGIGQLPPGWVAIRHTGPVTGYGKNSEVGKDLALKVGSIVRSGPSESASMVTMIGEGDRAEVVQIGPDWSQVAFQRSMILFLNPSRPAAVASATPQQQDYSAASAGVAPMPAPTEAAPASSASQTLEEATPREFQGYLMRTRRAFGRGPRLDYQLVDENGRRIALLDVSRLLITEPLENYENRTVGVFGPVSQVPDGKDIVVRVETLSLTR